LNWLVDQWWQVKTTGGKFAAPTETTWFGWKDGSGDLVINPALEATIPADVKAAVEKVSTDIKSGAKTIPLDLKEPKPE
jgi:basic membrane lipoprotein Med (substrate-binding protein (PBP1-ABC) superfamily)